MLVKVLKDFAYAPDCRTHLALKAGEIADVAPELVEGLADEGFVGEASDADVRATARGGAVEIPDDWRDLAWFQLAALARKLGADPKVTKPVAIATVEAELAARG